MQLQTDRRVDPICTVEPDPSTPENLFTRAGGLVIYGLSPFRTILHMESLAKVRLGYEKDFRICLALQAEVWEIESWNTAPKAA